MSVKNILYGTQNYVSHFVKTCSPSEKSEGKDDCSLHTSFLSGEKARKKAEELANNVPIIRL